jgi:hypothetical protein
LYVTTCDVYDASVIVSCGGGGDEPTVLR